MEVQNQGSADDWARTPMHLLGVIFEKLGPTIREGLQFGVVCERWHHAFKDNQRRLRNSRHHNQIPMLLFPDKREPGAWRAYDVTTKKFLTSKPYITYEKRFCGSSRGWLVEVNADWSVTLRNPFSDDARSIHLPIIFPPSEEALSQEFLDDDGLDFAKYHDYHVNKVLITADPLENPDQCLVITNFKDLKKLVFTKVTSSEWTIIPGSACTDDMILCETRLYSANHFGEIYSFNLENPYHSELELVSPEYENLFDRVPGATTYLVQSPEKQVYMIERHNYHDDDYVEFTEKFGIFRLDLDTGDLNEVSSIKDNVIFLGDNSSICVPASKFTKCKRNCIYFTHDTSGTNGFGMCTTISNVGVYHIPTRQFKYHPILNESFFRNLSRSAPIWVEPTLNLY